MGYRIEAYDGNGNLLSVEDTWQPGEEAAERRAGLIARVKSNAGAVILARLPDWKQRNLTARAAELADLQHERPLTAEESSERATLRALWAWVVSVRVTSDAIESDIAALPDSALDSFTWSHRWPAAPA